MITFKNIKNVNENISTTISTTFVFTVCAINTV